MSVYRLNAVLCNVLHLFDTFVIEDASKDSEMDRHYVNPCIQSHGTTCGLTTIIGGNQVFSKADCSSLILTSATTG